MQTEFRAPILFDKAVQRAKVLNAFLVIAGEDLLCQHSIITPAFYPSVH